jgi:putative ABC transport system permease protein
LLGGRCITGSSGRAARLPWSSKLLADQIFQILYDRPAEMVFTGEGNLIWLGIVLLLSVLASTVPTYNASRLTIREVLAYE